MKIDSQKFLADSSTEQGMKDHAKELIDRWAKNVPPLCNLEEQHRSYNTAHILREHAEKMRIDLKSTKRIRYLMSIARLLNPKHTYMKLREHLTSKKEK